VDFVSERQGITQCYLPPDTSKHAKPQPDRLVLNLPTPGRMEGWVDIGGWLDTEHLPVNRQSPIQIVTGSGAEQLG